jgi:hypothetical protein
MTHPNQKQTVTETNSITLHWLLKQSVVELETVIKLNQTKYTMAFLVRITPLFDSHCNTITMAKPNTTLVA